MARDIGEIVAELVLLEAQATPAPWREGSVEKFNLFTPHGATMGPERVLLRLNDHFPHEADAKLIAGMRNALSDLIAGIDKLVEENEVLRKRGLPVNDLVYCHDRNCRWYSVIASVPCVFCRNKAYKARIEELERQIVDPPLCAIMDHRAGPNSHICARVRGHNGAHAFCKLDELNKTNRRRIVVVMTCPRCGTADEERHECAECSAKSGSPRLCSRCHVAQATVKNWCGPWRREPAS